MFKGLYTKPGFKSSLFWVYPCLGGLAYVLAYSPLVEKDGLLFEICRHAGEIFLVSFLVGYISTATQFLGLVKKELENVIYAKQFLDKRTDLVEIWERVSKSMFKDKFKDIHKKYLELIKDYLPSNEVSYYNNYTVETKIEWEDKDKGMIKVTDLFSFQLKAETSKGFDYPIKTWPFCPFQDEDALKVLDLHVDSAPVEVQRVDPKKYKEDPNKCTIYEVTLQDKQSYNLRYKREQVYSVFDDNFIAFKALYIVNNLTVSLSHPEDINVKFIPRGTNHDFECHQETSTYIKNVYDGILLPKQGYVFILQPDTRNN